MLSLERMMPRYISDPIRIKQVLHNVIGNAIKFSTEGSVEVEVSFKCAGGAKASTRDLMRVRVRVKDQGIGLTPEQASRLFQPFAQADAATHRQYWGLGLGLVISRQIVRPLGGDLVLLKTNAGKGSTFEITIVLERSSPSPVREVENSKEHQVLPEKFGKRDAVLILAQYRILAVDDSPDNLTLIHLFLRSTGVQLIFAENGLRAIEELKKNPCDLILAHTIRSEHEKCRLAGCDEVVVKPMTRSVLVETVIRYLSSCSGNVMRSAIAP